MRRRATLTFLWFHFSWASDPKPDSHLTFAPVVRQCASSDFRWVTPDLRWYWKKSRPGCPIPWQRTWWLKEQASVIFSLMGCRGGKGTDIVPPRPSSQGIWLWRVKENRSIELAVSSPSKIYIDLWVDHASFVQITQVASLPLWWIDLYVHYVAFGIWRSHSCVIDLFCTGWANGTVLLFSQ